MPRIRGHISFRDATFGYDKSQPVVHGLTFDVPPGQMLGIVGKSGAGKTTTVQLLCRFYDVDRGSVEIDGVDIRKIRLEDVRRHIGIVLQEPILFSGTIADNISYGRPRSSLAEIIEAARIANAHPFILAKPDGYDTEVGEGGKRLSVGERQRVAIARAVLHDPRILILDEATSSVDALSAKAIHEALRTLARGRTTFVIAHRVSTLAHADRLIVLDRGRIREAGTYDELVAGGGILHRLVRLQEEPPAAAAAGIAP
jgi:ATP-binding cassette subfamily B protein